MDDDNLMFAILCAMIGREIAEYYFKNDKKVNLPFFVIYSLIFSSLFSISLIFFIIAYLIKSYPIPWGGMAIVSLSISLLTVIVVYLYDGYRQK